MNKKIMKNLREFVEDLGEVNVFENENLSCDHIAKFKTLEDMQTDFENEISIEIIEKTLELTNSMLIRFIKEEVPYLYEDELDIFFDFSLGEESIDYIESFDEKFSKDTIRNLKDLFLIYTYIKENVDFKTFGSLLTSTKLHVNVMPFQRENFNTEGGLFVELFSAMYDQDKDDIKEALKNIDIDSQENVIDILFGSQGYSIYDICDRNKVSSSKFLTSFYNELNNLIVENGGFLSFLMKINAEDYFGLLEGNNKLVFNSGTCGLFDPVRGGGSILDIELEKPFEMYVLNPNKDDMFYNSWLQIVESENYGYGIADVYGLRPDTFSESNIKIKENETSFWEIVNNNAVDENDISAAFCSSDELINFAEEVAHSLGEDTSFVSVEKAISYLDENGYEINNLI